MNITSAQYLQDRIFNSNSESNEYTLSGKNFAIKAIIDGQELSVPLCEGNRHYDEIMRQVEAGTLTIQEAE